MDLNDRTRPWHQACMKRRVRDRACLRGDPVRQVLSPWWGELFSFRRKVHDEPAASQRLYY